MAEPTIPELLRVGFKALEEIWAKPDNLVRVHWPNDLKGQGLCILHLASLVEAPGIPRHIQTWAFDTLEAAAAQYRIDEDWNAIPPEMFHWSYRVFSRDVERPKRPRGRDGQKNYARDQTIVNMVAWLRHYQGLTYEGSIELVAEAADVSIESVKTILKRDRDSGRPVPLERVRAMFSRLSIPSPS